MSRAEQPQSLKQARRCLARTRKGTACQCPAMPNGRCRIHGGLSPGVPGNQNALKHGRYSRDYLAIRRAVAEMRRELHSLKKQMD
ncbi:HGGxSTG domain-containing protein [Sphingomonas sp.]|uniref:HGGxSTG domain-containing protein n=1 Tax=Sphingomonas sp. TaxID=28214 RepID=UPI00344FB060